MVLSHKIIDRVEEVVAADVDEWTCGLGWLYLKWSLWDGSCKGLRHGLCQDVGPGLCLPFVGLIHGLVGQGTLARIDVR